MKADRSPDLSRYWKEAFERRAVAGGPDFAVSGWSREGMERRWQAFFEFWETLAPPPRRALDVGCGPGAYARELTGRGCEVVAADYSCRMLEHARSAREGGENGPTPRWVQANAVALPFRAGSFDLVMGLGVLQCLLGAEPALAEWRRVLRPGGTLVLCTLNRRALWRPGGATHRFYDPGRLGRAFRELGLREIALTPVFVFPPSLRWLYRWVSPHAVGPTPCWPLACAFLLSGRAP